MKTLIYCIGYDSKFIKDCNIGWGCGYIMIPINHPFLIAMAKQEKELQDKYPEEENQSYGTMQIPGFNEEITLDVLETVDFIQYRRLGFDCAHSWNTMENSGRERVLALTMEMQLVVESYK